MAIIECPNCGATMRLTGSRLVRFGHAERQGNEEWAIYTSEGILHRCTEPVVRSRLGCRPRTTWARA